MSAFKHPFVLLLATAVIAGVTLAGCSSSSDKKKTDSAPAQQTIPPYGPTVSMSFPDSLTGGQVTTAGAGLVKPLFGPHPMAGGGPSCAFQGHGSGDPFQNGFKMTRFMVGMVASWQCIADSLMEMVSTAVFQGFVPTNGTIVNIADSSDPSGPTGIAVLADASGQKTVKLYFKGSTTSPALYLSWKVAPASTEGRLVLNITQMMGDPASDMSVDREGPTHMRMDFDQTGAAKSAQMYIAFDPYNDFPDPSSWNNPWATGFRVNASKALSDNTIQVHGIMGMQRQFDTAYGVAYPFDVPSLKMFAVALGSGSGAAHAVMADIGLSFNIGGGESLGDFLFSKDDTYYFTATGLAEYINKSIASPATYKGGQLIVSNSTPPDTAAQVDLFLSTGTSYQNCIAVAPTTSADCATFLSALFNAGGGWGFEVNSGTEPSDARSAALPGTMLTQVYPDGALDWTGVFDMTFAPTN